MNHDAAIELLIEREHRRLAAEEEALLERHLNQCQSCLDALETYRLLADSLVADEAISGQGHPSSDELARLVVALDSPDQAASGAIRQHVRSCGECSRYLDLCATAVGQAKRQKPPVEDRSAKASKSRTTPLRVALAAGIVGAVVGVSLLVDNTKAPGPLTRSIAKEDLVGSQVILARDSISAGAVKISGGSEITLQAGRVVALGDGFSVDRGASLIVKIDDTKPTPRARGGAKNG
jgi:hypothetical protein